LSAQAEPSNLAPCFDKYRKKERKIKSGYRLHSCKCNLNKFGLAL